MSPPSHGGEEELGGWLAPVQTSLQHLHLRPGLLGLDTVRVGPRHHPDVLPLRPRVFADVDLDIDLLRLEVAPHQGHVELGGLSPLSGDRSDKSTQRN